jgi:hypothetical protein
LQVAESVRRKCIEANAYFRSILPKKYFESEVNTSLDESESLLQQPSEVTVKTELIEYFDEVIDNFSDSSEHKTVSPARQSRKKTTQRKTEATEDERFPCKICGKTFRTRKYLNFHERQHSIVDPKDHFFCDFCGYITKTKQQIRLHLSNVHSTT